jgi:vacuolar-type H+-ATPase subunit E/Vma4
MSMALIDILAAIEAEAGAELAQIARQAQEDVAQIRASARTEIDALSANRRQASLAPLARERARRLNRARLSAQRAAGRAREDLFREALDQAKSRLAELRASAAYPGILERLTREALAQLEGDAILRGDPRDADLLRAIGVDCPLLLDLSTLGGVEARSADGRIVVDNTLEARLLQSEPLLRQELSQWAMNTPTRDSEH